MKIILTTLSLGYNYTKDYTLRMIKDVLRLSDMDFYISTDCADLIEQNFPNNNRIYLHKFKKEDFKVRLPIGINKTATDFNFNLRYLCLEPVKDLNNSIIIFTDCDNSVNWYDKNILLNFIETKYQEGYDFFGSRTDYRWKDFISNYINKTDNTNIFNHKIFNYDLAPTLKPEWGEASLPAEYLLIFNNNNNKLNLFYNSFKYFHDYLASKEYTEGTWAEGFELGVSALLAGFKPFDIGWNHPIWGKMFTPNGYKIGPNAIVHPTEQI